MRLMASVLTTQEIGYNMKVAKALGLAVIVVVSSKHQMLDVLAAIPEIGERNDFVDCGLNFSNTKYIYTQKSFL